MNLSEGPRDPTSSTVTFATGTGNDEEGTATGTGNDEEGTATGTSNDEVRAATGTGNGEVVTVTGAASLFTSGCTKG